MSETTDNLFLGGRLNVLQPRTGYRAGADPVFLAAAVEARPGQTVLDLGCGVGTAMLCLAVRVPDLVLTGVEVQGDLARLSARNLERNGISGHVVEADLAALPDEIRAQRFDHVMTNPPFFDRRDGSQSGDFGRESGRGETMDVADWLDVALRRLVPGGHLTLINRIERLPDCLESLGGRAGDITVLPLAPRRERAAKLFVLRAIRSSRGPFRLRPPLVLHTGDAHAGDGDSYTPEAQAILRNGAALPLKD